MSNVYTVVVLGAGAATHAYGWLVRLYLLTVLMDTEAMQLNNSYSLSNSPKPLQVQKANKAACKSLKLQTFCCFAS